MAAPKPKQRTQTNSKPTSARGTQSPSATAARSGRSAPAKSPRPRPAAAERTQSGAKRAAPSPKPVAKHVAKPVAKPAVKPTVRAKAKPTVAEKPSRPTVAARRGVARSAAADAAERRPDRAAKPVARRPEPVRPVPAPPVPAPHVESADHARSRLTKHEQTDLRRALVAERARLTGVVTGLREQSLTRHDEVNHEEDGTDAFIRLFDLDRASNEQAQIVRIDAAIRAIDEGAYGHCERCGCRIEKPRLQALPFVKTCIKCQSEAEGGHRGRVSARQRLLD